MQDLPFVGLGEAGDQAEQRGLARSGRAEQREEFALGDVETGRRQRDEVAIALAEFGDA